MYLRACAAALERGLGAIVLVPEIALTPQTVGRFAARFGDRVAVLHSALTEAERRDERERIARGEARIVVGARSAVFAPVAGLGLVVVDEEHDSSFKQESDPRYDARTVAAKRAALEGAVAVYGSATPRAESWARLERLALPVAHRGADADRALVDLRREAGYPLSAPLLAELAAVEERGGRAILLLNRRGVSGAIHCRACGISRRCRSCDVALTLHRDERLHCHHCGYSEAASRDRAPSAAPSSSRGSARHAAARGGAREARPRARADPARRGHGGEAGRAARGARARFADARAAALIGTQMVAKGHHFPGVAVAAVVDADTGLAFPDFRAEERTFQLVTQLAGRSGRDAPGKVLVQTFQPDATPLALRRAARRRRLSRAGARAARGARATRPSGTSCRSSSPAPSRRRPTRVLQELRDALHVPGVRRPRAGPAPAPARPSPDAARREDDVAARARAPCRGAARGGGPGDAPRRARGRRRRRSAVALKPARLAAR